jgi:hypothetical protein
MVLKRRNWNENSNKKFQIYQNFSLDNDQAWSGQILGLDDDQSYFLPVWGQKLENKQLTGNSESRSLQKIQNFQGFLVPTRPVVEFKAKFWPKVMV